MNEAQKKKTVAAYMASVRFMDQQVGRLLDALDRLKIREETIVVFISDHGYNLGEHDCWSKVSLWEGSVRIPMIISYPGYKERNGTVNESISELIDLYPTLSELCGLSAKQPKILQGRSLAGIIKGEKMQLPEKNAYTITSANGASIRTDKWRYTRWGENVEAGNEELYNHEKDPEELVNLADKKENIEILNEMREKFDTTKERVKRQ
jgi:arylsulfatase A-like enzyme